MADSGGLRIGLGHPACPPWQFSVTSNQEHLWKRWCRAEGVSLMAKPPRIRSNGQALGKCSRLEPHSQGKVRSYAADKYSAPLRQARSSTGYGISREVAGLAVTAASSATAASAVKATGKERATVMGRAAESGCKRCASDWSGESCRVRVEWIVDGSPCKSIRKENVGERPRRGMVGVVGCPY